MDGMIAEGLIIGTLISTAVPAPETASIPTAKTAWDQWNRDRTEEMVPGGAAATDCIVCTGVCDWMFDDGFTCPSVSIMINYIPTLVIRISQTLFKPISDFEIY